MQYTGEIDVLERYEEEARSPSITIKFPAVARLVKRLPSVRMAPKFSRPNVYSRDDHRCQFCGRKLPPKSLNFDHVHPRSKGGKTDWQNIATACRSCNAKKGNKTLKESGMKLLRKPERPHSLPMTASLLPLPAVIPELWIPYLTDRLAKLQIA